LPGRFPDTLWPGCGREEAVDDMTPKGDAVSGEPAGRGRGSGRGARPRVLLADDYANMLTAIERLLSWSCDIVGKVTSGAQLLAEAHRVRPDVIVVDLYLPDMSGLDACRQLKEAALPGSVILLTAANDPGIQRSALESGAAAFVPKHRAGEELLPAIERAIAGRMDR
jgi:DNA-binding NarL/FixJ family response regulator